MTHDDQIGCVFLIAIVVAAFGGALAWSRVLNYEWEQSAIEAGVAEWRTDPRTGKQWFEWKQPKTTEDTP